MGPLTAYFILATFLAGFTSAAPAGVTATGSFGGFWDRGAPDPSVPANNFTVRWTGQVLAATTEAYTFITQANDGVRLWVNGQLVIDRFTARAGMLDDASAPVNLVAGQSYDVRMEYLETTGQAGARLYWQTDSIPRQIIPTADLVPPGT